MSSNLFIYNTLTRKKELFTPITPPFVGMYVCGPTVYGDAHLGHARPAITFDLLFRYLKHFEYKVRYVRNITDVGHLENDADEGEDKIAKKARLEKLEPMEIAQYYTNSYHASMDKLNVLRPSIEPHASGHIIEQIEMIQKIIENGFGYESQGSIYFDVEKYSKSNHYGILSGRVLEDLRANTRELDGQHEKRNAFDFALWKKATPEHIMKWQSPWGTGFPGWHLECSSMSAKYLGLQFDIHGGGLDLLFPHHECEIAQSVSANEVSPAKYWIHNNMITINGQKMGKSLGNFITLDELFSGNHKLLEKAYTPMTIRFFILQAHYRSTLDFGNEALQASEKGYKRLMNTYDVIKNLKPSNVSSFDVNDIEKKCYDSLNDDLNTPILIANLFEFSKLINQVNDKMQTLTGTDILRVKKIFENCVFDILGLENEISADNTTNHLSNDLMNVIMSIRQNAREEKNWALSDKVRDELNKIGLAIKDTKEGAIWEKI